MDRPLTLGSLFDGSGGFPLGALFYGIRPVWASEIEPFPIRVTTRRLPFMRHAGDVSRLDGAKLEPVDVITFGSPCTDMSVAGKRAGLDGDQSVFFYQAIRIIKEMRCATGGRYPRFIVWENVPGAFSSNGGEDFRSVLNAIVGIAAPGAFVPAPDRGRWPPAGVLLGDGWSVAYRTLDAQYFGVPQRRKRIYLVGDFGSERAGEILFEPKGVRRDFEPRFAAGQGTSETSAPGADGPGGRGWSAAYVCDARGNGNGVVVNTLTGDHENRVTDYTALVTRFHTAAFMGGQSAGAGSVACSERVAPTLRGRSGGNSVPMLMQAFGVCSFESEAMRSANPRAGFYKADTTRTLDRSGGNPACRQGGVAIACAPSAAFEDYQYGGYRESETFGTLRTSPGGGDSLILGRYLVRRLTPTECGRLQGFPDGWCAGLETPEPAEDEIAFWTDVWETHRKIMGTSSKPKSRNQIIRWLQSPYSDSAEYKMWGNGVALPCVCFVMAGIAEIAGGARPITPSASPRA